MTLRCAYCHADHGALSPCSRCGTQLHAECWADARVCPTLGCGPPLDRAIRTVVDAAPRSTARSIASCLATALTPLALMIGGCWVHDRASVPTIEVRNDSGRVLRNVRVEAWQMDEGERVGAAASLDPGESVVVHGGNADYSMELHAVTSGAKELAEVNDMLRFRAVAWQRSVYAIDAAGRLRTVLHGGEWGERAVPCSCPDDNASRTGSSGCEIELHREDARRASLGR